jgi:ATP-dependent Lon protease
MVNLLNPTNKEIYPLIPIRDGIVFPQTESLLIFGRPKSVKALEKALSKDKKAVLVMQKNKDEDNPNKDDLYKIGVLVTIEKYTIGEKQEINALVSGINRVEIEEFVHENDLFEVIIKEKPIEAKDNEEIRGMIRYISNQVKKAINLGKAVDFVYLMNILNLGEAGDPVKFAYQVAAILEMQPKERQELLEINDLTQLLKKEIDLINREVKILEIEKNISTKTQKKFEENVKESILREKMREIEEEL